MTRPALDCPRPASAPVALVAPVFLNFRSEIVRPVCFAIVYWDGPGDRLYAFEDRDAFERQRKAADWTAAGGSAVLHEASVGGVAAFGNLKLAPG